jgi:protein-tyrosine phosphatase
MKSLRVSFGMTAAAIRIEPLYSMDTHTRGKDFCMDVITQLVQIDDDGQLFLSGMIENWQPLLDKGIDTVIDLEGDVDHGVPTHTDQFLYIYLPIHDAQMPDLDRLHGVARLAADLVRKGGTKVLAHCGLGLNRSALMIGLIMMYLGGDPAKVVEQIRARRPGALYNDVFANYLLTGLVK